MLTVLITKKKLEIKKKKKWNIPYTAIYTKNITINTTTNAKIDVSILMYGRRKKNGMNTLQKYTKKWEYTLLTLIWHLFNVFLFSGNDKMHVKHFFFNVDNKFFNVSSVFFIFHNFFNAGYNK